MACGTGVARANAPAYRCRWSCPVRKVTRKHIADTFNSCANLRGWDYCVVSPLS